ncbi:hypothetical protein [Georgenia subflava]|uniref:Uncharacterized protein n=1 Tax=Georgenia subflava TaxID=1622177 RepID=A0A6N7EI55_9MICO|nr:hypothetical protein [Georgenia subflava]MPV35836.1 hypothetical protein [Georgenia subflava]
MNETPTTTAPAAPVGQLRRIWPSVAGVGFAALVGIGLTGGVELAPVLAASAVVYLGAAAVGKPAAAWPMFFATALVITLVRLLLDERVDATWFLLGGAALLAVYGFLRGGLRPAHGLPLQSVALVGFGGAAVVATGIDPDLGGYLVAAGLLGHAAWDFHHHRTERVVARSLAEFCLVLDTVLAVTIVLVTVT